MKQKHDDVLGPHLPQPPNRAAATKPTEIFETSLCQLGDGSAIGALPTAARSPAWDRARLVCAEVSDLSSACCGSLGAALLPNGISRADWALGRGV